MDSIINLKPQIVRQLFSVEQYKQFYEDIVCGYIEFLKPNATRKQILDAHMVKRLKLANIAKHKVSKPYRQFREPFRELDLIGIYRALSDHQFAYLVDVVLTHYCEALHEYIPTELVDAAAVVYSNFLIGDMPQEPKESKPIGRPSKGVTT